MTKETMARHLWMDAVIAHVVSKKCDPSRLLAGKGALRDRLNRAYAMGESVWMAGDEMVFRLKQGAIHDRADREARALSGLVSKARKNRTASLRRGAKRSKHLRRKTARTRLRKRISRRGRAMSLHKERLYHVVAINARTGRKVYLTSAPDTHSACRTILRKQTSHKDVRKQLEPVN